MRWDIVRNLRVPKVCNLTTNIAGPNYNFDGQQTGQIASFYNAQRAAYLQPGSAGEHLVPMPCGTLTNCHVIASQ